ncbi:MAG: NADH-quinone oxidoreductase subunit M [Bryobacteraceae bacterium]|nr:NADH-quinone oxidoreductase subunit M [Bryobacteraceae bacterium]
MEHFLSILIFSPLACALAILLLPGRLARAAGLAASAGIFLLSLPLWFALDRSAGFQFIEKADWIPTLGASYHLAADGYSAALMLVTALATLLSAAASWNSIETRRKEFYALLLVSETAALGAFAAMDLLLFFVFFEFVLAPVYLIILIWGSKQRSYAATKFLVYTIAGSILMLLGILLAYVHGGRTFDYEALAQTPIPLEWQRWIFWLLLAGFAVKIPMIPLHTWLPDAHTEAPTAGSVILAGVLLKLGTYGLLRFSLKLAPDVAREPATVYAMGLLSLIAIVYGALLCIMQKDWKRLIAYSSISHMGFCTLGIFAFNEAGMTGSMLQQVNHGVSTSLLFLLFGMMYDRQPSREIAAFRGLWRPMPRFAAVFAIAALSSMGMPPLNGFIGEFTVLRGAFEMSWNWALWGVIGIALSAAYLLWLYQRTMLGETSAQHPDLGFRELAVCAPLLALIFWLGLYPKPAFEFLAHSARWALAR